MSLIIVNFILGVGIGYLNLSEYLKYRNQPWAWIRLITAAMGAIWAIIYTILFFMMYVFMVSEITYQEFSTGSIRPAITITLGILLSNILITRRGNK